MKICISSGHAKKVRGAAGPAPWGLDEVNEARKVVESIADHWRAMGVEVATFHDDVSTSQSENLNRIVNWHNSQGTHELDVSIHFNAYSVTTTKPMGCEVLYVTQSSLASKVSAALAGAAQLPNRGGKKRTDLAFLNGTHAPAVLVETLFVDAKIDADHYRELYDAITEALAESLAGRELPEQPEHPPPLEPGRPDRPGEAEENRFVMTLQGYGDMTVTINGQKFVVGDQPGPEITISLKAEGEPLVIQINGQEFHGPFAGQEVA